MQRFARHCRCCVNCIC